MLKWYDKARRPLPWRAPKGKIPDPYHVWLSEIMAQQTTIPAVIPYFLKFLNKWPTVRDLANATADDVMQNWAGLGYYARARNLHKCAQYVVEKLGGKFPSTQKELQELPGIGDYTANAIAALAFDKPANVVDANVERVMARIFAVTEPLPDSKRELKKLAGTIALGETKRAGDYAQSVMELGALVCTPTSVKCGECPVNEYCKAQAMGIQKTLPARREKGIKPKKHGYIYLITGPTGEILFERRNEKGMLGGTIGIPTSDWVEQSVPKKHLPMAASGKSEKVLVKHGFTHFNLELHGFAVILNDTKIIKDERYFWVPHKEAANLGIPTIFKKALKQFIE